MNNNTIIKNFFSNKIDSQNIKNACLSKKNILNKNIYISNRIGTESRIASVFKACIPKSCKYTIAVKQVPLKKLDKDYINTNESLPALNKSFIWRELYILKLCKLLIDNGITSNLPYMYKYFLCNKCDFNTGNPKVKYNLSNSGKSCLYISVELANGDLKNLLINHRPYFNSLEINIIYFQIYVGVYCLQKYFNIEHQDLHWGNVLYKEIPKGGYIKYIIDNEEIIVPNIGYRMILWDFEFVRIKDKIEPTDVYYKHKNDIWEDYKRITSMLYKDSEQKNELYDKIGSKLIRIMKNEYKQPKKFVKDLGIEITKYVYNKDNSTNNQILETYNTDKKIILKKSDNINRFLLE